MIKIVENQNTYLTYEEACAELEDEKRSLLNWKSDHNRIGALMIERANRIRELEASIYAYRKEKNITDEGDK